MPRLDGAGPMGEGPMTGWSMGYCAVPVAPVRSSWIGSRRGRGYGRGYGMRYGRGYGKGFGRGFGLGFGSRPERDYSHTAETFPAHAREPLSPEEETRYLEEELQAIEKDKIDILAIETEIKNRLEELKK